MVKLKKSMALLTNVKFLYFVFFLTIINLGYFLYNKDNQSIFLFTILCLIIYLFNNNMIVVLLFSMFIINGLILINKLNKEGFKEESDKIEKGHEKGHEKNEKVKESDKIQLSMDELYNKNKLKLEESIYPNKDDETFKKKIDELAPLSKVLDGLNINEINNMINKLNTIIEKF